MNSDRVRILVVDDEPDHRLLIQTILNEFISQKLDLAEACDGLEALKLFQTWRPDLILMDLWMPHMNGETAIRQIRALESQWCKADSLSFRYPSVRILVVTAATFESDRASAFTAGCDGFIRKPLDLDDFLYKLTQHLDSLNSGFSKAFQHPWPAPQINSQAGLCSQLKPNSGDVRCTAGIF
ncbi:MULTISPECIES: response regulator [unclassified Leptolyngbya]|uniref:response regulator n=1 Tax=unclassified Leptolyngbya TaxID=2650499 RepID=UPI001683DBCA|nr:MULTISPECIES: response regulator [unclassified Leptolyngbya]MBD1913773.1 response regulator [Leptolyngbya sp. FACHB-8]MBD2156143.1 response regulator [Leptolyngbya sp. FACHB-16]